MSEVSASGGLSRPRTIGRVILGLFLLFTGVGHLTFGREEFIAQVPDWLPLWPPARPGGEPGPGPIG
jgi:hypothetical protein